VNIDSLGGVANHADLAACGLGLFLFLLGAAAHIFLFNHGRTRDRYFPMAIAITGKIKMLRISQIRVFRFMSQNKSDCK
jgi:hypothetical protein